VTSIEQEQIFKTWLDQYKGLVFKIVRAYAFTVSDQDDLFQEIALQIWGSVPSFQRASSVSTWVYRVAINTAIKWVKKEQKHQGTKELSPVLCLQTESSAVFDDRLDWLYQEIHKLDKIDRSLSLLLLDGLSYKEMSDILGITESNVGVKINRIKKQLIAKSVKYTSYGI
jgi:RNA polymerase sigma-70 factor, ECF subfamily